MKIKIIKSTVKEIILEEIKNILFLCEQDEVDNIQDTDDDAEEATGKIPKGKKAKTGTTVSTVSGTGDGSGQGSGGRGKGSSGAHTGGGVLAGATAQDGSVHVSKGKTGAIGVKVGSAGHETAAAPPVAPAPAPAPAVVPTAPPAPTKATSLVSALQAAENVKNDKTKLGKGAAFTATFFNGNATAVNTLQQAYDGAQIPNKPNLPANWPSRVGAPDGVRIAIHWWDAENFEVRIFDSSTEKMSYVLYLQNKTLTKKIAYAENGITVTKGQNYAKVNASSVNSGAVIAAPKPAIPPGVKAPASTP